MNNATYGLNDFKVTLINAEDVRSFVKNHGEIASICYDTPKKYANGIGKSCLESGHTSGSRGDFFKFEIDLIPRYCCDQIIRHEQGIFKNVQSQRYVDQDNFKCYTPDIIVDNPNLLELWVDHIHQTQNTIQTIKKVLKEENNITGEDANDIVRGLLPIGCQTKLVIGFTIEALIHFMGIRLCVRADKPIRTVAMLMRDEVQNVTNAYNHLLVPQCRSKMYCPEHKGCGIYPSKSSLQEIIKLGNNELNKINGADF